MQQTTLRQTLQKKRASNAFFVLVLVCAGCSSGSERVYVDLSKVPLDSSERIVLADSKTRGNAYRSSVEVPDLEQRDLFIGSAEEKARDALKVYLITQEQAVASVLARLEKAYSAEIDRTLREDQKKVEEDYQSWFNAAFITLRSDFETHATIVGELRTDLTGLVGFPDPDPRSVRVPPAHDKEATERFKQATSVRQKILEQEEKYNIRVRHQLDTLEERRAMMLTKLSENAETDRKEAILRAKEDSRAVAQQALAVLERTALAPETQLPRVPGAQSSVDLQPVKSVPLVNSAPPRESKQAMREQLDVFLKVMNYKIVDNPKRGRDVTTEFLEWRQKYANKR